MYGVNEDRYWDQYQVTHDPQWHDEDGDVIDDFFEDVSGAWEYADIAFEENRLEENRRIRSAD